MGIADRYKAGRSKIVPFKPGEDSGSRHYRRLWTNLVNVDELRVFCEENFITLRIRNEGHHWIFLYERQVAEWWPSSAKLVMNKQWDKGFHAHDYQQVQRILKKRFLV